MKVAKHRTERGSAGSTPAIRRVRMVYPALPRSVLCFATFLIFSIPSFAQNGSNTYLFNDSHFHLTNYIQEGIDIHDFLKVMGNKAGRVALFGIPLQQQWSYRVDENRAPTYYLNSDAPLYYYSFTDAWIATAYKSLSKEEQARFDPMITGFNPTDMYAADHIRRVLTAFPGVFSGIGEFSIHKEFVSAKIAGEVASLQDPALDRLLDFATEVGLVVLIHNDVDVPFAKPGAEPAYASQMKALFKRHPNTTFIWAHIGVGRIIRPVKEQAAIVEEIISDPQLRNVHFDISWDEVAKYVVATPESTKNAAAVISRNPDRFLFGTDEVAPATQEKYLRVYNQYEPLWKSLTPEVSEKVRKQNYERIFDEARRKVRSWEATHIK
ncbi:MAG TPA: amidohydrolase family protein [Pyrinomonadaceae bacterium]